MSVSIASTVTIAMTVLMATQDVHDSQVNVMHPAYVKKLGFEKNNGLRSKTFGMVIVLFAPGQDGKGSIPPEELFDGRHQKRDGLVLGMLFLTPRCADIWFASGGLARLQKLCRRPSR